MLWPARFLPIRRAFFACLSLVLSLLSAPSGALPSGLAADDLRSENPSANAEDERDETRPGLFAVYRALADPRATLMRIDAKPAFTLGESSPHPRIPPGPFEVAWTGLVHIREKGPFTFGAFISGHGTLEVDGTRVLDATGRDERTWIEAGEAFDRPPGLYPITIRYRSLPGTPARLQLWWRGGSFSAEPLPAWQLRYRPGELPTSARGEQQAAEGRAAAQRLGCARCHRDAFPGVNEPAPGPALADAAGRLERGWLLAWLADPAAVRPDAHMPRLFSSDRAGFVERYVVAELLAGAGRPPREQVPQGDHRMGRRLFVSTGCAACHYLPELEGSESMDAGRSRLAGLRDRFTPEQLAVFLRAPEHRYPDGRMPQFQLGEEAARDIAAYLWVWSSPDQVAGAGDRAPDHEELDTLAKRLAAASVADAAAALVREKGCIHCHPGLGEETTANIPIAANRAAGCLSGRTLPSFPIDAVTGDAIAAYLRVARSEQYPSRFEAGQRQLDRAGCFRCHQHDSDRAPAIERIGSKLGGAWLQETPFQRTPRLHFAHQKYTQSHLLSAVRDGVSGLRSKRYTYRMPAFGERAERLVQALAEGDGDLADAPETAPPDTSDPTAASLVGPTLVGFQGYSCVSCHVWNGELLADPDPGALGPDLSRVQGRIRRAWFDRFLENPARFHPGTPMPAAFFKGQAAPLRSVFDGDVARQRDALWRYLELGKQAPSPQPAPALPVAAPQPGDPVLVAQIPIRLPGGALVESISVLNATHDLAVYDLARGTLRQCFSGAQILRDVRGRLRSFRVSGSPVMEQPATRALRLVGVGEAEPAASMELGGYDRLDDGVRIRSTVHFASAVLELEETVRLDGSARHMTSELNVSGVPRGRSLEMERSAPAPFDDRGSATTGSIEPTSKGAVWRLAPDDAGVAGLRVRYRLPAPGVPPPFVRTTLADRPYLDGSLERPGYRARVYPRPKTISGEDRIMPAAVAVDPGDGRVFVSSMKTGELFVLSDASGDEPRFENYAHGLFEEAFSMLAERDCLYVLHRRNLTKIEDTDGDGVADRFDRVRALPHGVADSYDYAYGLARDRTGGFVISYAPYANRHLPGSGGAVRLAGGAAASPVELGYGMRNPVGWCAGPEGEIFFTDNQGEWVATNKLCHLVEGRFYGFPNPEQAEHANRPAGKTAVWVPYGWAHSVNGVAFDNTGGKFGPFTGQLFLAELMFGGAILRADVEKVNGEYQGVCFPFWGRGLLGPLSLAFDPRGPLYVGAITEPGWMAQPDRGALFRIDFTGETPFEMRTIRVRPDGFRIEFTRPVSRNSAGAVSAYHVEHYRYEYTGAYGSPELDHTPVPVERVAVSEDGQTIDLTLPALVRDRVYLVSAPGVHSSSGESLVHATGAYTLIEIPSDR